MHSRLTVAILSLLLAASATAAPLDLGVYAPRLLFSDNVARTAYARDVARAIEEATGLSVQGRAFTRESDLKAFIAAERLDLVLADVPVVAGHSERLTPLADGTGGEGRSPAYALLSRLPAAGLNALEGRELALVDAGGRELVLLSNLALEGEASVGRYFGRIDRSADLAEVTGWLTSGRVFCTFAYASLAPEIGLHVAVRLKGVPLPVLAEVGTRLTGEQREAISKAVAGGGLPLPPHGPLTHLVPHAGTHLKSVHTALALPAGQRPVRRAVWSPVPVTRLGAELLDVSPRGRYPLPTPLGRWRTPEFVEVE